MSSSIRTGRRLLKTVARRFRTENMAQTSAALAFTTLLGLVPLATLVASLASSLPLLDSLVHRLENILVQTLLPAGAAGTIANYVGLFARQARRLTVPGILMLIAVAFFLMLTVERAFNHLWQVKPRPFLSRLKLYAFAMAVWPFMLGAVAALISYAVTISLGFVAEPGWFSRSLMKAVPLLLLWFFLTFLYYAVPNARVGKSAALVGGAFASMAFGGMQKGFELYLGSFGLYKSIYGAFAAVPIFLVWLQLSWAVVLIGGLIAATAFRPARP